ncbi:hypothetical protein MuYL_3185 [Mucilaginibacter xinganensis]|uniref:Uncharacterized protein n=1 Tax=Mucilaginibacter xinganensis TaxID=1234841 RepID=A0A223NZ72_9SPHI|nr:hypothetical protein MuYL_3185 [Mucilaginibacter xinganensis]
MFFVFFENITYKPGLLTKINILCSFIERCCRRRSKFGAKAN